MVGRPKWLDDDRTALRSPSRWPWWSRVAVAAVRDGWRAARRRVRIERAVRDAIEFGEYYHPEGFEVRDGEPYLHGGRMRVGVVTDPTTVRHLPTKEGPDGAQ